MEFFMNIRQFKLIATALLGIVPCFAQAISSPDLPAMIKNYINERSYWNWNDGNKLITFINENINNGSNDQIKALQEQLNLCKEELCIQKQKAFPFLLTLFDSTVKIGLGALMVAPLIIPCVVDSELLVIADRHKLAITCGALGVVGVAALLGQMANKAQDLCSRIDDKNKPIQKKIDAIDEVLEYITHRQRFAKRKYIS